MGSRSFSEIVSIDRLRLWAKARDDASGLPLLARRVLECLEKGDPTVAADAFFAALGNRPGDYFYNMTATIKRRYADGIALAFCEGQENADALFEMMKERKVIGRTRTER